MCGSGGAVGRENVCGLLLEDTTLSEVKAAGMAEIRTEKSLPNFSVKS